MLTWPQRRRRSLGGGSSHHGHAACMLASGRLSLVAAFSCLCVPAAMSSTVLKVDARLTLFFCVRLVVGPIRGLPGEDAPGGYACERDRNAAHVPRLRRLHLPFTLLRALVSWASRPLALSMAFSLVRLHKTLRGVARHINVTSSRLSFVPSDHSSPLHEACLNLVNTMEGDRVVFALKPHLMSSSRVLPCCGDGGRTCRLCSVVADWVSGSTAGSSASLAVAHVGLASAGSKYKRIQLWWMMPFATCVAPVKQELGDFQSVELAHRRGSSSMTQCSGRDEIQEAAFQILSIAAQLMVRGVGARVSMSCVTTFGLCQTEPCWIATRTRFHSLDCAPPGCRLFVSLHSVLFAEGPQSPTGSHMSGSPSHSQ